MWRYQLNVEGAATPPAGVAGPRALLRTAPARLVRFVLAGGLLGVAGFWWAPEFLDATVGVDPAVFGPTVFLFMAWTFINIHHYFLDAVIWRRDNADMRRHLFPAPAVHQPAPAVHRTD